VDGLLVIDKPAGPTSHDVVAAMRRVLGERRVGHTGTLDPAATGILTLVLGRATRLAKFLSDSRKTYDATVTLGAATDTADAAGVRIGAPYAGPWPSRATVDRALDAFRGVFVQQPPAYSAKKIAGRRSYALARRAATSTAATTPVPQPVAVTTHRLELVAIEGDTVRLLVECSAGFYVRALAHDLGERLGTGAHLTGLRRTRSGDYSLADAIGLDEAVRDPDAAAQRVIPLAGMLASMPAVVLTDEGLRLVTVGRDIGPHAVRESRFPNRPDSLTPNPQSPFSVRLVGPMGNLVGIAEPTPSGVLHPSVVLV